MEDHNVKRMLKNPKYTVAIIKSKWHYKTTFKNFGTDYEYVVNGKKYLYQINDYSLKINEKYLVVYDSLNPNRIQRLITSYRFPQNTKIPFNGWKFKDVPIKIDSLLIKNFIKEDYKNEVE